MKTEMDLIAEEVLEHNASNTGPKLLIPGNCKARAVKYLIKRENGLIALMDTMMYGFEDEMEEKAIEGLKDDDESVQFHSAAMAIGAIILHELQIRAWFAIKHRVDALKKAQVAA